MRLIFKHLCNSVLRRPLQSVLLLVTVFLSAVIFACSYEVAVGIHAEMRLGGQAGCGSADVEITATASSPDRFVSAAPLRGMDGIAAVGGYYAVPAYDGAGAVFGAAADFASVSELFTFWFTAYGRVTGATVNTSAFVSESYARSRGLAVGDAFTLSLLGLEKSFTVQGIHRSPLFGSFDVLINAEGALALLAQASPVFAAFDAENLPYSTLLLRLEEGADAEKTADAVRNMEEYSSRSVHVCGLTQSRRGFEDMLLGVFLTAIILLAAIVACVLVFFSLDILAGQRTRETRSFLLAGTPPAKLFAAQAAEMLAYLIVGTAAGLALSVLILHLIGGIGFVYASVGLTARGALVCAAAEAGVGIAALFSHRISLRKGEGKPRAALGAALSACVLLAATVAARLLPVTARWYASVAGLLGFLGLVLFGLRPLLEYGSRALARVIDRPARAAPAPALLAAKNCGRVVGIRNVSRILGVLLSVVVVFAVSFGYCVGLLETAEEYFRCDFVVAGAGGGAAEAVGENEDTQAYCTAFLDASAEFSDGKTVFVISAEDASFLAYAPRRLPQGNEIVLSEAVAALYGLKIGDGVTLKIGRGKHEFVLAGYSGGLDYAAFIDASACGLEGNMLLIRAEAGTDLAAYRRSLADSLAAYGALVEDAQTLLSAQNSFLVTFLRSISVFIGGIFVIVAVGASDLVGVTYARRRGEMRSLRLAGMTRRNVAAMVVCEGCLLALAVCLVAAAGGAYLCWLLDCGMRSFGYALL